MSSGGSSGPGGGASGAEAAPGSVARGAKVCICDEEEPAAASFTDRESVRFLAESALEIRCRLPWPRVAPSPLPLPLYPPLPAPRSRILVPGPGGAAWERNDMQASAVAEDAAPAAGGVGGGEGRRGGRLKIRPSAARCRVEGAGSGRLPQLGWEAAPGLTGAESAGGSDWRRGGVTASEGV